MPTHGRNLRHFVIEQFAAVDYPRDEHGVGPEGCRNPTVTPHATPKYMATGGGFTEDLQQARVWPSRQREGVARTLNPKAERLREVQIILTQEHSDK